MFSFPTSPFRYVNLGLHDGFCLTIVVSPTLRQVRRRCKPKRKCHVNFLQKVTRSPPAKCLPPSYLCTCPVRPRRHSIQVSSINFRSSSSSGQSSAQSSPSFVFSCRESSDGRSTPFSQNSFTASSPSNCFIPGQPRIQISSLLADSPTTSYHLEVVQHPQKTAEFGSAVLSRLPLTPPIIAQLIIRDHTGNVVFPEAELPFLIAHLSLFTEDGLRSLDMAASPGSQDQPRRLLHGNLVSSAQILEDLQGNYGLFFVFSDVSIRWRGRFQLGVTLLRLSRTDSSGVTTLAESGAVLAQARTRPFDVLPYHEYTAAPITRLTQCFIRQGARIFYSMSP